MKPSTTLLAAALALTPAVALPCSQPPSIWTLATTSPAAGALDVPTDAPLVFIGQHGGWTPLDRQVVVEVTLDGQPVAMHVAASPSDDLAVWRPDADWLPGETYEVAYGLVEDAEQDPAPLLDGRLTFSTGAGPAPALAFVGAEATARIDSMTLRTCVDPPDDDYTDTCDCNAHRDTGTVWLAQIAATVEAPPGGSAMLAELRLAATVEGLATPLAQIRAPFGHRASAELRASVDTQALGADETVCWQAAVLDMQGQAAEGPARCAMLAELDGYAAFADRDAVESGCDVSGGAPAGWPWLLGLLAFVRRRRR